MGDLNAEEEGSLPSFRYHADPVATGSVEAREDECLACGRGQGFIYVGPVYAVAELDERVCPWCIADGSVAERYDAAFTDVGQGVPDDVPGDVLEELERRTPGFTGWQQERWLYHCRDAATFLGPAGWHELQGYPEALEMLRHEYRDGYGSSEQESDEQLAALDREGDSTAYLFRCLRCGSYLAFSDFA